MPVLDIQPKISKSEYSRDNCTPMFTVSLFVIAMFWNQHRCLLPDEYVKKMLCVYTVVLLSQKKNEIMSFVGKWVELYKSSY
jgi:hypothetical protein